MSVTVIGTCSLCNGPVATPSVLGIVGASPPPTVTTFTTIAQPKCERCGATPAQPHGPVIKMQPKQPRDVMPVDLRKVRDAT